MFSLLAGLVVAAVRMVRLRGYCPPIVTGVTGRRTSQREPVRPNTPPTLPVRETQTTKISSSSNSPPFSVISSHYSRYSDVYSLYFIISPFLKESYINEQLHYSFSSLTFSSDWAGRLFYCCSQKTNFSTFTAKPPPPFPHLHCPNHH